MVGKRQTWTVCLSVRTKTFYCSTKRSKEKSKTTWFLPEKSSEKTQATQLDNLRLQPTSQRSCSITSRRASEIVDKARQFCCLGLHVSTEFASWHLLHPVERKHKPPIINYMAIRMLFCGAGCLLVVFVREFYSSHVCSLFLVFAFACFCYLCEASFDISFQLLLHIGLQLKHPQFI